MIGRPLSPNLLVHNPVREAWGLGAQRGGLIIPDYPRKRLELKERFDRQSYSLYFLVIHLWMFDFLVRFH